MSTSDRPQYETGTRYDNLPERIPVRPMGSGGEHVPDMPLLWRVKKARLSRQEWEAVKRAGAQYYRKEAWTASGAKGAWGEAPADDVLAHYLPAIEGTPREATLLGLAIEVARRMDARTAYRYRSRIAKRNKLRNPNHIDPAVRSRAIAMLASGMTGVHVAKVLGVSADSVYRWQSEAA